MEKETEKRIYKRVGAHELELLVTKPEGWRADAGLPAIVWIHGGGWKSGYPERFVPHSVRFAARGAVCFSVRYRLVGQPLGADADGETATVEHCVADCRSAVRYIRMHAVELGIDPTRIAACGDSAGGHLASCLATLNEFDEPGEDTSVPALGDAVINMNGVVDLTRAFLDLPMQSDRDASGDEVARYLRRDAQAKRLSPVFHSRPGGPPMLQLHGLLDTVVLPDHAVRMHEAHLAAGNHSELVLYPDAKHAFVLYDYTATEAQVERAVADIDAFLTRLGWLDEA
ncbi:alpha/beta hydrolase [Paenibacillus sp. IB182496]|uniref:Alpha/beta hydrolase n=1 Tax=Paenibacillus sabuli TaxID=2772509 RepID=A0A927GQZ2_9BACL|nr:alpha/beta hydrolase [Paenibacillus sabuli]MBD2844380.1 alpha/beta hydrolase [Paenibacillus sabuli]